MPLSGEDRRILKRVAANDPSIAVVSLYGHGIGDDGAKRFAKALRGNTAVTYLNLYGNSIGAEGAKALAKMLLHNSSITKLHLYGNDIGAEGAKELANALLRNSSVTTLTFGTFHSNDIGAELKEEVEELVGINERASSPQEALGRKVERRVASSDVGGMEAAVSLTLERLDTFPSAHERRELFGCLLGSERGREVAAAVDVATGRTLYWLAAECGAAPGALMSVLRAHPSLVTCRDAGNRLYPFMLLATMPTAGVVDVFELLLRDPALVEGGIRPISSSAAAETSSTRPIPSSAVAETSSTRPVPSAAAAAETSSTRPIPSLAEAETSRTRPAPSRRRRRRRRRRWRSRRR